MKTAFAVHKKDGVDRLFIEASAIMEPICALIDGLPITVFPDENDKIYLSIDTALKWVRRENTENQVYARKNKHFLPTLIVAKHQFVNGKMIENTRGDA